MPVGAAFEPTGEVATRRRMALNIPKEVKSFSRLINIVRFRVDKGLTTDLDSMGARSANNALKCIISAQKTRNLQDETDDRIGFIPQWVNVAHSESFNDTSGKRASVFRLSLRAGKEIQREEPEDVRVSGMTDEKKLTGLLLNWWGSGRFLQVHAKGPD